MQWTDELQIHIHTVLHQNKGDENTRGHLGTELNNKAETILQVKRGELDKEISIVSAMCIREIDFEPFAFRINEHGLPELLEGYTPTENKSVKGFDYFLVPEEKHKEALTLLFSECEQVSYKQLITQLQESYKSVGYDFGISKSKQLKVFLENKRMILKDGKNYKYNPDFYY